MKTIILYEDNDIIVCDKPAGLAVQSARLSEPDMVSELKNYLAKTARSVVSAEGAGVSARCGGPGGKRPVYLGIIHRLDQPVSGILVFAKNQRAAAALSSQLANHTMQKTYRARVMKRKSGGDGRETEDAGAFSGYEHELTDYMVRDAGGSRVADPAEKDAKKAQLLFRFLDEDEETALLEIELKTGRHHQIRVQMSHAGMPLLGDNRYGTAASREISDRAHVKGIQLQAVKLCFTHPATGKKVCYELDKKLEL